MTHINLIRIKGNLRSSLFKKAAVIINANYLRRTLSLYIILPDLRSIMVWDLSPWQGE
jgi:hypothetical protein